MPLGAFHYAFASQDELMRAVVDTVTEQERFAAQAGSWDARSLESALRSGFETYIGLLEANPERELVLMELALFSRRHSADGMRDQWSTYFESAAEMLSYAAELTGSEWTSPLDELARLLVALLDGITLAWLADRDSAAARRTAEFAASGLAAHARSISD
jgi:AcrR family transcriptional regulator